MVDRLFTVLRGRGGAARSDLMRMLWDAGVLRLDSPRAVARAVPHLAARGPHLGVALLANAYTRGDEPAVVTSQRTLSFRELNDRAVRIGRGLRRRGVRPGDRVGLLLRGGVELLECVGAAQKAAACPIVLHPELHASSLRLILTAELPRAVICDADHEPSVQHLVESMTPRPAVIAVGDPRTSAASGYENVIAGASRQEFRANPVPQPVIRFYQPRGGPVERHIEQVLAVGLGLLKTLPMRRDDLVLIGLGLHDPSAFDLCALAVLVGCTVLLDDGCGTDPTRFLRSVAERRATVAAVEGALLASLDALPAPFAQPVDAPWLRSVLTYSRLPARAHSRAVEILGPVLHSVYATPRTGWVTVSSPSEQQRRPDSVGRALPGVTVTIRDTEGRRLPPGETGRVWVSSEALGTASAQTPTAERGWLDEEAYLHLVEEDPQRGAFAP